ncbi:MAG: 1-acyl-sn-glycerol-3-phosphate acyltransferase [Ruminococcaceae bacterium]|nr:1-acyl-sn-glycerol-3-phosphate acyltransferase [Oscillospiraceae bacterium]
MTFYERIYKTFEPAVSWIYRIEPVGVENIPEGGAILASNHTSFADVLVISAAAKRQVRYMAKKELFKTPLAPLIKALGAYPVDRGGADVGSIKNTISLIGSGELVGIFPQGHRCGKVDPRTTEIKAGVGMIAYHTKATVIPVFIDNARLKTGAFRKNRVIFGKPISFEELEFKSGGRVEYMNASRIIFDRICEIKYGKSGIHAKHDEVTE